MKRALIAVSILLVAGCGGRYLGWEQVRIENEKPSEQCVYKAQEACSAVGAKCYTWYKQRATVFGANTVVMTHVREGQTSGFSGAAAGQHANISGGSSPSLTALADYYACPAR